MPATLTPAQAIARGTRILAARGAEAKPGDRLSKALRLFGKPWAAPVVAETTEARFDEPVRSKGRRTRIEKKRSADRGLGCDSTSQEIGGYRKAARLRKAKADQPVEAMTPRAVPQSAQDRKLTRNACRPRRATKPEKPADPSTEHSPGAWPIADLRPGQCRFACTPHDAASHRFCGAETVGPGSSWCAEHLSVVTAAKTSGGVSVAEAEAGRRDEGRQGWMGRIGFGVAG